ncbi:MAG: hypothetical protein KF724_04900 [Phycisphaeraceae bacterium]|nr:hypothetical protein [Phycisphaeraceae bacterium]
MLATRALMSEVLDYAGLFPPAKLDMPTTVRNYAELRTAPDRWMLGRLIVPVARLTEFEESARSLLPQVVEGGPDDAWLISAIAVPVEDPNLERDLAIIAAFNERHGSPGTGAACIDAIELRAETAEGLERALDLMPDDLFPWFELPVARDVRGLVAALADMEAGAKIRTGGTEAATHPAVDAVAAFLEACRAARVPFKATAGLHHAVRQFVPAVATRQFGFLNVMLGAALLWHGRVTGSTLREILSDEQASHFALDDRGARWCDHAITTEEIEIARGRFVRSFGSCSFDEPLQELRTLHLLSETRSC